MTTRCTCREKRQWACREIACAERNTREHSALERLKAEAAELGANAILLQGFDTNTIGAVGSGYANTSVSGNSAYTTGLGYSAAQTSKVGKAIAIYIKEE